MKSNVTIKLIFAICIVAVSFQSCTKGETSDSVGFGIRIRIGDYPVFKESEGTGNTESGKTEWKDSDAVYLVLQTEDKPLAARYRITRASGKWSTYEKYEGGNYLATKSIAVPGDCRAVVYYAPAYSFDDTDIIKLNEGSTAGLDEFLQWESGDKYDITFGTTISIDFKRGHSRIRAIGEAGYTIKMQAGKFIPAGYKTETIGTKTLDCVADENGNAFYYGTWSESSDFKFNSYDTKGVYSTCEILTGKAGSEDGKSYTIYCNDTDFVSIAALAGKATTISTGFSVKLKNAVVSYSIGEYAHIEDETGAILVFAKSSSSGLREGQLINGTVSGNIQKYNGLPEILSIDCSKAALTSDGTVSQKEMTIADLLNNFDANLSRRILIKGVSVDKGISAGSSSSRTGSISQNGNTLAIYATNASSVPTLESDLTGDITVFPTYHKSTKQASFYEEEHFVEKGLGEDTPFTRLSVIGYYSSTDTENPVAVMTYEEGADQFSCSKSTTARSWNLFNLEKGTYALIDFPTGFTVGGTVTADINVNGKKESHEVTVARKAGKNVWLEDKTNHVGYVINIQ